MMSSYSITKGMVYDVTVPDVVTFGDSYVITSKSFFSPVSYEYRMVGEDTWNDELPLRTGEYEVKITTTRLFGQKKETIYDFLIQSKEVELSLQSSDIQFGDEPQVIAQLYEGDYIDSVEYKYGNLSQNVTSLDLENIVVKDLNGVDVTNSYQFHFQTTMIRFIPRIISVQPANQSKVYDGEPLQTNETLLINGSLLDGHSIQITTSGSQTNVGSSSNTILSATIWDGEVDVSENYEISFATGTLEVTPRPITIQTSSDEFIYDGSALVNEDYQIIEGEIVDGQTISVISNSALINAGELPNVLEFSVFDGLTDKTDNYEITILTGTLSVLPRPITIETSSDVKTYDGLPLWNEGYLISAGNLVLGQTIFVVSHTPLTDAGEIQNELAVTIQDGTHDYTNNYVISFVTGTLKVTPRSIWIQPVFQTKVYDGSALQSSEVEVYGDNTLVEGHLIIALVNGSQTIVGSSPNIILSVTIWDGDDEVTDNYQLNFSESSLSITKRPITIDTASAQKIYDGLPLWSEDYQITQGLLVEGQSITVTSNSQITNFGELLNTLEISIFDGFANMTNNYDIHFNEGTLTILQKSIVIRPIYSSKVYDGTPLVSSEAETIGINELVNGHHIVAQTTGSRTTVGQSPNAILNAKIFDGDIEVSNNYIITYQTGVLEVTRRPITITTASDEKIYNGMPLWNDNFQITMGSIVDGHTFMVTLNTQITNAGVTPNILEVDIYDGITDMTGNYAITYATGTLTITPRPITLETATDEQIYDGTSLWNEGVQIINGSLVGSDTILVTTHTSLTNVGVTPNTLGVSIYSGDTLNTMNYAITFVKGTLTVTYREITIRTSNGDKTYDGTPLWNEGWLISDGTLAAGQSIVITSNSQLTNVGNLPNILGISIMNGLEDTTSNYAITLDTGTLSVIPRPITILTNTDSKIYDGTPLWNEGYLITSGSLVFAQTITIVANTQITSVGDSLNSLIVSIDDGVSDMTGNYIITYIPGTLSISPRPIEIKPIIQTRIYDGTALSSNLVEVISPLTLVCDHVIIATTSGSQTNVGSSSNIILTATITSGNGDVSSNYDISFAESSLVITPRPIVIQPVAKTKIYDGTPLTSTEVSTIGMYALVGSHQIHANTSGSQTNVGTSANIILSATIWDGAEDVTYNYEMSFAPSTLEVTPRPITLQTASATKVYNGTPLWDEDVQTILGSLVIGHGTVVLSNTKITNIGETQNTLEIQIVDGFVDMTTNYQITIIKGTLKITPRPITIETAMDEKIYDGSPLWNEEHSVIGGTIVAGQTTNVVSNTQITSAGEKQNVLVITIFDGEIDLTNNYEITYVYGTLQIRPRPIIVQPTDESKIYDGTPLTSSDVLTIGLYDLVAGHVMTASTEGSLTNVGVSENIILNLIVWDGIIDVSANYDFSFAPGTLEVTPRPIVIRPTYQSKIYDGTPLTSSEVEIIGMYQLIAYHQIIAITSGSRTNVGSSDNIILSATVWDGENNVTYNYDISFEIGKLDINPRPIEVHPVFQTKVYDGNPLTSSAVEVIGFYNLVGNHQIIAITSGSQTNVGTTSNIIESATIWDGTEDVTYNYYMTFFNGLLEVTVRYITIETAGAEKVYDGISMGNELFEIIDGSLAPGQSIFAVSFPQITNVGEILNSLGFAIYDGSLETTENYLISYVKGTLKVTPRPITIETATDTKIYDGTPLWNETTTVIDGSIVDGQSISVLSNTQITNVGQISNHLDVSIMDGLTDLTFNYQITFVQGELTIIPRSITILTASDEKVYDGTSLRNEGVQVVGGSLIGSQVITVTSNTSILNVGQTPNTLGISIFDGLVDMTDNYEIIIEEGTLRITPRPITIETATDEKNYDGTPLWNENVHVIFGSLVNEQFISISSHTSITTVGEILNTLEISIFEGTTDVTNNYQITVVEGTLKITPRPITIETASDEKIYDKTPLFSEGCLVIEGSLVGEQTIHVTSHTEITNAGEIENTLGIFIFDGLTDMSQNYDITFVKGILTIIPKTIKISTPSASKPYDGTPLTATDWELTDSQLLEGDYLNVNVIGSITSVGKVFNKFEYEILDANDVDVSSNYLVVPNIGILEVTADREVISISTGTDAKTYDGVPLTKDEWWVSEGSLLPNHTIVVTVTGEIVEVGEVQNGFTYTIYDELGADVTDEYNINPVYGTLTILGDDENGDSTNSGTSISSEGNLDGVPPVLLFQIYSSITDTIYLRAQSYGEYTKTGWSAPQVFESPYGISPFLFPFLNSPADIEVGNAQIKAMIAGLPYFLPYYPASGLYDNINDVYANYSYGLGYNIQFIPTRALNDSAISLIGTPAEIYEMEYRMFVYDYYMQLPESTKNAMLEIARLNGLDSQSETIIQDVQNYITSAAIYNMSFKPIPSNADFAVYFLTESREGICQHFAMAATVMFRALGIPARYVTGYVADATANEWTDVTSDKAHAWVEIYIDGFGWVPIEVTPGGAGGGTGGSGGSGGSGTGDGGDGEGEGEGAGGSSVIGSNPDDETLETIDIISGDASKIYDGSPLTDHTYSIVGSLQEGHTVVVEMNRSITQVGQIRNEFTVVILDDLGNDVSDLYNIRKVYGWLVVVPNNGLEIIEIKLYDNVSIYDGNTHSLGAEDYWIPSKNLPAGYQIKFEIIGETLNVDKVIAAIDRTTIRILDENMIDVTQNYNIVFYDGSVEVIKRAITICLINVAQYYDGLPLTSEAYYLSVGTLVEGDTVILTTDGSITDVGSIYNNITSVHILNVDGVDVTSNYSLRTVKGLLTVLPE